MVYNPKATLKGRVGAWAKDNLPEILAIPVARVRARYIGLASNQQAFRREFGLPLEVVSGPFRGMKYIDESTGSSLVPKILGTYELELHSAIEDAVSARPTQVIDVGSAEGYYAVGLACRLPEAQVITFDTFSYARFLVRKLARVNGVADRVTVDTRCDPSSLRAALTKSPKTLLFCDCEGYEVTLLDPAAVAELGTTSIVVETHDFLVEDATEILERRFAASHNVARINAVLRGLKDFPISASGADERKLSAMDEHRPPGMSWLYMTPRSGTK